MSSLGQMLYTRIWGYEKNSEMSGKKTFHALCRISAANWNKERTHVKTIPIPYFIQSRHAIRVHAFEMLLSVHSYGTCAHVSLSLSLIFFMVCWLFIYSFIFSLSLNVGLSCLNSIRESLRSLPEGWREVGGIRINYTTIQSCK